jgi:large conductance mechanosensitive channel
MAVHARLEKGAGMLKEFKEFAIKGNMLDLAVGIIIGVAFGTVINSLVNDILMPLISGVIGTPDFSNLFLVLRNPTGQRFTSVKAARDAGAAVLAYGLFLNAVIAFLIVALALFFVVKGFNRFRRQEEAPAAPPAPPEEVRLLGEIRDLLKRR